MKTITADQAAAQFDKYLKLAHEGHRILVTVGGEPWVMLAPVPTAQQAKPAGRKLHWPDFAGRLAPHYPQPVEGPNAAELLARDREDRF